MGDDIRLAGATDAGAAAEILADGFQADPFMRWVFGDGIGSALLPFFYERHGFTVLEKTWLPDGPVLTPMWRAPTSR